MSSNEENKMQQVDVENLESVNFNNPTFRENYGVSTMEDAKIRTERMIDNMKKENHRQPSKGFVNEGLCVNTNARLSVFEGEKVYANEWTNSCLNVLEAQLLECQKSAAAYGEAAVVARKKHRTLSIPLIVVGTAATALSFLAAGDDVCSDEDNEGGNGLKYSVALLTSIVSIGTGVSALYSFSNKMTRCIGASGSFTNLARRIRTQLFLPNHLRAHAEVCLVDFGAEHAHLVNTSPLL